MIHSGANTDDRTKHKDDGGEESWVTSDVTEGLQNRQHCGHFSALPCHMLKLQVKTTWALMHRETLVFRHHLRKAKTERLKVQIFKVLLLKLQKLPVWIFFWKFPSSLLALLWNNHIPKNIPSLIMHEWDLFTEGKQWEEGDELQINHNLCRYSTENYIHHLCQIAPHEFPWSTRSLFS